MPLRDSNARAKIRASDRPGVTVGADGQPQYTRANPREPAHYCVDSARPRGHDGNGDKIEEWVSRKYRPTKVAGTMVFLLL